MTATRTIRTTTLALLIAVAMLGLYQAARAQTPTPEPLELGARLFAQNCAVCHGPQGQGRIGATLAKNWPSIRPDLTVENIIQNGVSGSPMPAWSQANGGPLSQAEIDALVQYILSWETGGAPVFTPAPTATLVPPITPIPNVAGDPNKGAALFAENCVVCHGPEGQGRIGATLAQNWPGVRPDLNIRNTIASGVSGSQMPAWGQAYGGPLNETEIDNLVAYILTLKQVSPVVLVSPIAPPFTTPISSPLSGWLGVILFVVLFVVIVAAALILQRRKT
jgi:cytochrome c oxidase cbb3-type subunit 3